MKVMIKHENQYFNKGVEILLQALYPKEQLVIEMVSRLEVNTLQSADIAILQLAPGDGFICNTKLMMHYPRLLVGVVNNKFRYSRLTHCMKDMLIIQSNEHIDSVARKIKQSLRYNEKNKGGNVEDKCRNCQHYKLSDREEEVVKLIFDDLSVRQISERLSISKKTVYSHKQTMKSKFNLQNNYELVQLLHSLNIK